MKMEYRVCVIKCIVVIFHEKILLLLTEFRNFSCKRDFLRDRFISSYKYISSSKQQIIE